MTSRRALDAAERMGRRAGEAFRDLGIPSPAPFTGGDLRVAWARGYAAALAPRRRRGPTHEFRPPFPT